MKRLTFILGTRPEAIKLMPVILEARRRANRFETMVVSTAQHREMLDGVYREFEVVPDVDLDLMRPGQQPAQVLSLVLSALHQTLEENPTDCVVVQGDTMTTLGGALAASFHRCRVAHVEAGLRSFDRSHPWPEEDNRRLVTQVTDFHFAPTAAAQANLLGEGVQAQDCWVTGNTGLDALRITREKQLREEQHAAGDENARRILLTCHRRESFGAPMASICVAMLTLLEMFPELRILCPLHRNPAVRDVLETHLAGHDRIRLVEPMDYAEFLQAMAGSDLILTDSGGVQEEAPSLGRPVLVLRETTERPEAVEAGVAKLVGTETANIVEAVSYLLSDKQAYRAMARVENPFGDGFAAARILDVLEDRLG